MAPSLGGWRKALPRFKFSVIPELMFYFQGSVKGQLGVGGVQRISERERHQGGKENMDGIRDVKLCLVYNLGEGAFLTCH